MTDNRTSYSPYIQIYLETADQKIRLADVLFQTATLYEKASIAPHTVASLVLSIDGVEEREEVLIEQGISEEDTAISFRYTDPNRLNGRNHLNAL